MSSTVVPSFAAPRARPGVEGPTLPENFVHLRLPHALSNRPMRSGSRARAASPSPRSSWSTTKQGPSSRGVWHPCSPPPRRSRSSSSTTRRPTRASGSCGRHTARSRASRSSRTAATWGSPGLQPGPRAVQRQRHPPPQPGRGPPAPRHRPPARGPRGAPRGRDGRPPAGEPDGREQNGCRRDLPQLGTAFSHAFAVPRPLRSRLGGDFVHAGEPLPRGRSRWRRSPGPACWSGRPPSTRSARSTRATSSTARTSTGARASTPPGSGCSSSPRSPSSTTWA